MSAEYLGNGIRRCSIDLYVGPPDVLVQDSGTNFIAKYFNANLDLLHINCNEFIIEGAEQITFVERYHATLNRAFKFTSE